MPSEKSVQSTTKLTANSNATALARAFLGRALGFRDCPSTTLDALVATGRIRKFAKNQLVASRGEAFDFLCLLVEGSLETSITRHDGHRHLVGYLQPGDMVGMISLLDGLGPVSDLRSRASATLLMMPGDAVRRLRESDVGIMLAFERQLAFRSRMLYERLAADPSLPMEKRLARLLRILANLYGHPRSGEVVLDMKISQADLGDWLGVSRQRVNYVVQQLQLLGLIRVRYSTIVISDPDGLATMASA